MSLIDSEPDIQYGHLRECDFCGRASNEPAGTLCPDRCGGTIIGDRQRLEREYELALLDYDILYRDEEFGICRYRS